MLLQDPNLKVWVYRQPVDIRKPFDGLAALVHSRLQCRASSGERFVFINRHRTQMKILYYRKAAIACGASG